MSILIPLHITSLTWARNEQDIVETFVRYNLSAVNRMVIVCHRCIDGTKEILEKLVAEGLPVEIREDDSPVHRQSAALTELMHEVADLRDTDWILPLDADEFLVGDKRYLTEVPGDTVVMLPWKTYVPTPSDAAHESNILKRIMHRRSLEEPQFYKVFIPKRIARLPGAVLPEGNHAVMLPSGKASSTRTDTLWLAHFPVRTEPQLRRKIRDGWESHRINPERKSGQAFHWKALYDRCLDPRPVSDDELKDIALRYAMLSPQQKVGLVCDPVPSGSFSLRYDVPVPETT